MPGKRRRALSGDGVFTVAYGLLDGDRLEDFERERISALIDWFEMYLPEPECLEQTENVRAICWFRSTAYVHLRRTWELVILIQTRGVPLALHKSRKPGEIIYGDRWQIAAKPLHR